MATEKQIAANRLNAQKCTGPRTPEGKAISSRNALKTGLHSKAEVMDCEDRDEYEALIAQYYADFAPVTTAERCLVDTLIRSEWLGRRYAAVETSLWERGYNFSKTPLTPTKNIGLAFLSYSQEFIRLDRCRNSAQRNYDKALAKLREIQAKRATQPQTQHDSPSDSIPDRIAQATANESLTRRLVLFRTSPNQLQAAMPQDATTQPQPSEKQPDHPPIAA